MIKVYMNKTFPKEAREPNYRGLTQLGTNIGPGTLEYVLVATVATIVDFWAATHPEESRQQTLNRVSKAMNVLEANITIEKAIE